MKHTPMQIASSMLVILKRLKEKGLDHKLYQDETVAIAAIALLDERKILSKKRAKRHAPDA